MAEKFIRKSVSLTNDYLISLANRGGFSQRLDELASRYTLLLGSIDLPEFTDKERAALGEVLLTAPLTHSKLKTLAFDVLNLGEEFLNFNEREALSAKLDKLSVAQIIKLLEVIGSDNC